MAASVGEHARLAPGMLIQNRYEVIAEVGCGNFSKVYKCRDTKAAASTAAAPSAPRSDAIVAVKVVKKEYANDASFEQEMLRALGAKDPSNTQNVSKMHDFFVWNRFPCFVMPLRGPSLRTRKLGIAKGNTTRGEVVRFAREMLRAIAFSSFTARIVHTDLKPENILLTNAGASSTNSDSDGGGLGSGWMVCDWGSASHWRESRMDSDLISTRPYRAPEAVLGNPWSFPADVWSLGCIIFEAANGSRLFEVHDDNTHLHHMLCRIGALPELLTKRSKHSRKYFDANGNFLRPLGAATSSGASAGPRRMSDALAGEPELLDLLAQMLQFDPSKRIRADDALKHPIFAGFADAAPAEPAVTAAAVAAAMTPAAAAAVVPVAPAPAAAAKKTAAAASETAVQSVMPLRKVNSSPALASAAVTPVSTPTGTSAAAAAAAAAGKFRALPPLVSAAYRLSAPQQPPSSRAIAMASESAASQAAVRRGSKGPVDKDAAMIAALEKQLAAANIAVAAATADAKENGAYGGAFSAAGGGANAAGSLPNTPPTSAASFRTHHNQQPQPRLIKRPSVAAGGGSGVAGKPSGLLYR